MENNLLENLLKKDLSEKNSLFIIHRAYITQVKNKYKRTASTKTRSEVSGGGRKPWKQKGTGRARSGSNTSPLWKGGGVIFGPRPRTVKKKINIKERQLALTFGLYAKRNDITIVPNFDIFNENFKTKTVVNFLENLNLSTNDKIGLLLPIQNKNAYLATRNLKNIILMQVQNLDVEKLLSVKRIVTTKESIELFKTFYSKI